MGRERSKVARMVAEFNEHPNSSGRGATRDLLPTLHREEHDELLEAIESGDPGKIARELADVVYLAYTEAWARGLHLDAALAEIHRAAMDKMVANVRRPEDGKIIKPPGFRPPDMTAAVAAEGEPVLTRLLVFLGTHSRTARRWIMNRAWDDYHRAQRTKSARSALSPESNPEGQ